MTDFTNPYQTQINDIQEQIKENQILLNDAELRSLAQEELKNLQIQLATLQTAATDYEQSIVEQTVAQTDPTLQSSAILELRAGAGGDEAKIWAADLLRMYTRYSQAKNLKVEFIDELVIKISKKTELILEQPDPQNQEKTIQVKKTFYPYQLFKHEAGVHRVQRVPTTETQGRIHTSTASVAVLPEIKAHHIEIRDEDLTWEFMRSGGAGGQSVNKTSSAVRLTHKPSGIMVRVSQERKQLQNRQIALDLLRGQLWEVEEEKRLSKLGNARAAIGRNMRAEKIRTFNYPQNRVTDHRINHSWHQLESIIEGDLDPVISTIKQELAKTDKD
jgi:peptide chain release factor 1